MDDDDALPSKTIKAEELESRQAQEVVGMLLQSAEEEGEEEESPESKEEQEEGVYGFVDGQAVQLEDGSTAIIHTEHSEGFQAVQLEDGTIAYLSTSDLFTELAERLEPETVLKERKYIKKETSKSKKVFRCEYPDCFRVYTTYHHLKVHGRSHTGDRPYRCAHCPKTFATNYGLKSHTRVHTGETPYRCLFREGQCDKAFKTSGDLQKHMRTHTGERPFKCLVQGCDRRFTTSNIRKMHVRTHTGERPYTCPFDDCGRAFASATNYKNHTRIHTGEKPYACGQCGKRFTEYSSLYKHNVVHTHSKPYRCNACGKAYRQPSTLNMHRRNVHNITLADSGEVQNNVFEEVVTAEGILSENSVIAEEIVQTEGTGDIRRRLLRHKEKDAVGPGKEKETNDSRKEDAETTQNDPKKTVPAVLTFAGNAAKQNQGQGTVFSVQFDGGVPAGEQIVLVADAAQLAALQALAQSGGPALLTLAPAPQSGSSSPP